MNKNPLLETDSPVQLSPPSASLSNLKISVALCTYNGARYLREQLDSLAAQTRPPDEVVICDDCSIDATVSIAQEFAREARFPVRLYLSEENKGSTASFERAVKLCDGDIIALCDQDDVWHPGKLMRMETVFSASPQVGAVFTDAEIVDENLQPLGYRLWQAIKFKRAFQKRLVKGEAIEVMVYCSPAYGMAMAFRATFKDAILPVPVKSGFDMWAGFIVGALADLALIEEPLVKYRQHAKQQVGVAAINVRLRAKLSKSPLNDRASLITAAAFYEAAHERVKELGRDENFGETLALLREKIEHTLVRANIPENRLRRLAVVTREVLTLRYFRYSSGVHSVAKDLFL